MERYLITQAIYRHLLSVMSRPGTIRTFSEESAEISPNDMLAAAVALLDQEVSYAVLDDHQLDQAIRHETDARPASVAEADFIFITGGSSNGRLDQIQRGTHLYPDAGATVIYQAEHLAEAAPESTCQLSGPGIAEVACPLITGVDTGDLEALARINQDYPLGIDMIFIDTGHRVMAIPRSTKVTIKT